MKQRTCNLFLFGYCKMQTVINLILFVFTFIVAVIWKKKEWIVVVLLLAILLTLFLHNNFGWKQCFIIVLFGFIMATAEYICIKWFHMWKYNYVNWIVPVWLPLGWSISGVFLLSLLKI